ncbi:MAG: ung [Gammaproteobacteria bacterium]|jgi:uracil-DNA glycosylase|nr:ung [Gammaproteobacteria bacterium]
MPMEIRHLFNLDKVDSSWRDCLIQALTKVDPAYLAELNNHTQWLPGPEKIFNAFTLPINKINYVLLGESPYPRPESANGYAFWDASVTDLWSATGLSKSVNRATSLRNLIKMLLLAKGALHPQKMSQADIAQINKDGLVKTNHAFFNNFLSSGFLLLNTSLVLQSTPVRKDAKAWQPFLLHLLNFLYHQRPHIRMILLGNLANAVEKLIKHLPIKTLHAEHPYNISFIFNPSVLAFFKPLDLLSVKSFS